jgi:hypothetical protein
MPAPLFQDPQAATAIALLQAPGEYRARLLTEIANAQANAQVQGAQAWSGGIQNAAQAFAQVPQQMQAQKMQALQAQDIQGQIAEREAVAAQRTAQTAGAARDQRAAQMWAEQLKANVNPETGRPDYEKAAKAVSEYFPVQANTFLEGIQKTESTRLSLLKSQAEIDTAQKNAAKALSNHMGELAAVGLNKLDTDTPQNARDHFLGLIASAAASGAISEKDAHEALMKTASAGPDQLAGIYSHYLDAAPEVKTRLVAEDLKKAETAKNLSEANKQPTAKSYQKSSVLLDGKPAEVLTDPTPGGKIYDLDGKAIENAANRIKPIPTAAQISLNSIGGDASKATAKAIAEYRIAPPSARTLASPAGESLMLQVMTENPAYQATEFPTRQKMRAAFTSGAQSQTINSLNTAIGHLDQFTNVIKALDNGNFRPGNEAYNWLRSTFGDSAPTNFEGIRSIMSGELASAFKKSGATDQEIASVEKAVSSKNSTKQLMDYVKTIALPALGSKVISFDQQYRQVMGKDDPFKILLPESEEVLKKYGIDPAHPTIGASGSAPSAGRVYYDANGDPVKR